MIFNQEFPRIRDSYDSPIFFPIPISQVLHYRQYFLTRKKIKQLPAGDGKVLGSNLELKKSCLDSNRNGGFNYLIGYFFTPTYLGKWWNI